MVAHEPWKRKTPLRRTQMRRKRPKDTGPIRQTKNDIWRRAGQACERCGKVLDPEGAVGSYSIHHRRPRGMGGSKVEWINDESNLLLLCGSGTTGCHGEVESHRAESYEAGWLVHSYDYPWDTPVEVHAAHPLRSVEGDGRVYLVHIRSDGEGT